MYRMAMKRSCVGEKKLREMKGLESGELRIGASDMTLRFFLLPYLQKFHEAYPKIKLTVTNGPDTGDAPVYAGGAH